MAQVLTNQNGTGNSAAIDVAGGEIQIGVQVVSGSPSIVAQELMEDGATWLPLAGGTFTASEVRTLRLAQGRSVAKVRLAVTGTGVVNAWI